MLAANSFSESDGLKLTIHLLSLSHPRPLEQSVQVKERFAMRLQFASKVPNKTRCISASARMEQITVVVQGVSQNIGASSFHAMTFSGHFFLSKAEFVDTSAAESV